MSNTQDSANQTNAYNEVPVHYCTNCLSLNIRIVDEYFCCDYCDDCSGTNIDTTTIAEWEIKYKQKYNKEFITKK